MQLVTNHRSRIEKFNKYANYINDILTSINERRQWIVVWNK